MIFVLYAIHVAVSLFLVLVVLLQQGKGADLSVFGGGASQAAFGARGAATLLHKLTVGCFVLFILTTLSIGFLQKLDTSSVMSGVESVMDEVEADAAEPAPDAVPAEDADGANEEEAAGEGADDEAEPDDESAAGNSATGNQR